MTIEKIATPIKRINAQNIRSPSLYGLMSPKPTVEREVKAKEKETQAGMKKKWKEME